MHSIGPFLFLFGGLGNGGPNNHMLCFDTIVKRWRKLPAATGTAPVPRAFHGSCVVDNCILIHGGQCGQVYLADFALYRCTDSRWMRPNVFQRGDPHDRIAMLGRQQIRESLMPPRSDHVMVPVSCSRRLTKEHGASPLDAEAVIEDLEHQQLVNSSLSPSGGSGSEMRSCVVGNRQIFIFGGSDNATVFQDTHLLDTSLRCSTV